MSFKKQDILKFKKVPENQLELLLSYSYVPIFWNILKIFRNLMAW